MGYIEIEQVQGVEGVQRTPVWGHHKDPYGYSRHTEGLFINDVFT